MSDNYTLSLISRHRCLKFFPKEGEVAIILLCIIYTDDLATAMMFSWNISVSTPDAYIAIMDQP